MQIRLLYLKPSLALSGPAATYWGGRPKNHRSPHLSATAPHPRCLSSSVAPRLQAAHTPWTRGGGTKK